VVYPGTYPITRNTTRLSEVVAAAGGFTPHASVKTSQLVRRSVNPTEIDLERLESLRGGVTPEDSAYYYLETALRIQKEIVSVDFEALFARGDSTEDVYLQTEDEIHVPVQRQTIYVFGQVVSPGHVGFRPGESYEYYISQAGGFTERARAGDAKIVKAKTRQWLSPSETAVEEGDYVWVPKDPEYPFGYYLSTVAQVAAVLSVALSVVLLTVQISQN
jgi:protein involved in polysaccharide export with SLBB domain